MPNLIGHLVTAILMLVWLSNGVAYAVTCDTGRYACRNFSNFSGGEPTNCATDIYGNELEPSEVCFGTSQTNIVAGVKECSTGCKYGYEGVAVSKTISPCNNAVTVFECQRTTPGSTSCSYFDTKELDANDKEVLHCADGSYEVYINSDGQYMGQTLYCRQCETGYTRQESTTTIRYCTNSVPHDICVKVICTGSPPNRWESANNYGVMRKARYICDTSSGTGKWVTSGEYDYQCAGYYYGTPRDASDRCTPCPSIRMVSGSYSNGESLAGSTSITQCYIPSGWKLSDATGEYNFTQKCYYSGVSSSSIGVKP